MKTILSTCFLLLCAIFLFAQCNASFTWDDTDITIQFMDTSTSDPGDPIVSWFWDFDDNGNTSNEQNPLYTFSEADKYDVVLQITTQNGCTSSIEIEIETCVLAVSHTIGVCDANGNIPVEITINDPWDVAEEVDIILDGQSVPGSPFNISAGNPINITVDVPGDGLSHIIQCQSIEIATCGKNIEFVVEDCSSDCFLSGLQVAYPAGVTHTVDVGDDFFSPVSVGIVLGDIVNFDWVGDGHSTTSDATSGPDAWNSGVISIGSSFDVIIDNPGIHPYYCIPHGGPGGVGMSGEILANCPTGNSLDLIVSFNTTIADPAGYNVYYDGVIVSGSPFAYSGTGGQSQTISIAGDGLVHPLIVEDVNDPSCTLSLDYNSPDCDQGGGDPVCTISVSLGQPSGCDANQDVTVDATVNVANGGSGFNLSIDGGVPTFFAYNGPSTTVEVSLPGDGQSHTITVTDQLDSACSANTQITSPNCTLPCNISNLVVAEAGASGGITHTVEVEDFIFNPSVVNITTGDVVEWIWTGEVAHTATSDATSGPDSWDSGLLNTGATYTSPILSEGEHPYYCIPHGNPGGAGMAGTIFVLPPCNVNGEVTVNVNFDVSSNGTSGYEVLVDGVVAGTFSYVGGTAQSASVNVLGDAMSHTIQVRDIDDNACTASADIITGDCDGGGTPECNISATSTVAGACDANNQVPVDLVVTASDQSSNFSVEVDGVFQGTFPYTGSITNITIDIDGDGQDHTIVLTDGVDATCTTTTIVSTPNCTLPCNISNLVVAEAGASGGITHTVDVEDFIFNPSVVNITTGDIVEWIWTGDVAHTATSDATSGPDSWDSGLLNTGATYTSPILSEGEHPYYCIPHGSPGGVGMAGTIFVLPPCNANGEVTVNVNFDVSSSGTSGYEVLVDGAVAGTFSYVGGTAQSASVNVLGDAMSHTIQVRDIEDNACTASADIITGDCDGGGTPECNISATSTVAGACDANNQVPVDLVVTASDQSANFSVEVDGVFQGSFSYTGSITNITIHVDGNGQDHTIEITDNVDAMCTTTTVVSTQDCFSDCEIIDINLVFGENTTHIVKVEDFEFVPDSISIALGDTILFDWTGIIPHTATSDTVNGPDSFDSGLQSQGASYELILTTVGDHPYYCVPHGAPGGIGMAGNIFVSPVCDGEESLATLSVQSSGSSGQGFNLLLDGNMLPESPLAYSPAGISSSSITIPGDSMNHVLVVSDIENPTCVDSISFLAPYCIIDSCNTMISNVSFADCDGATTIMTVDFNSLDGQEDHNLFFNGNLLNATPVTTDDQGQGTFSTSISGLGDEAELIISNILFPTCGDTILITTPDCNVPCLMSDVSIGSSAGVHVVEVRDFDFFPKDIEILIGDTVRFSWTGEIPHTTTSDATSGMDVWDSGLFGEGHVYDVIISSVGDHPYYCVPHGGPGGIGMAGSITAIDTCVGDQWLTNYTFSVSAGSPLGYNIFVDGEVWNTTPIAYNDPVGVNTGVISLPGDEMSYLVTFQDVETDFCAFTTTVTTGACGAGCTIENLTASVGSNVIHEIEVRDFDFFPQEVTVRSGETIRFIWTGDIAHTSTSDIFNGSDSWDSGLLSNGDTFEIVLTTPGEHLYYCIPHGGPGGIGQSGIINVLPQCQDGDQEVHISFDVDNGSDEGYKLFVDGTLIGGLNPYNDPDGGNDISLLLPADGLEHIVTIQDDANPICAASTFYQSEDCATDCEIAGLTYELVKNKHVVEVRDFDFMPLDVTVEVGDTILFDWIGEIAHTVTSDVTTGASAFNSGLLQEGDQWILILDEIGEHPYYCIPHGGPGGIGMAGNITVTDACDDGEVTSQFTFTTSRLSGTYDVFVNGGNVISGASYSGIPENSFSIELPAEDTDLLIEIEDQLDSNCASSLPITAINCNDPCFEVDAEFSYDIDFATMEVIFSDMSSGNILSWSWDFGDGGTSSLMNPIHSYTDPIVYEVCLTVIDDQDCTSTFCDKVRFSDEVCVAGFTYLQNDLDFIFVNTSDYEDPEAEILWTFGDGDISNVIDSIAHTFDLGVYTVCIQISSDSCVTNYCEELDLSDPCLAISPDFVANNDGANLTVNFEDMTTGMPDSWLWGFGDGNTSIEQNPSHSFASLGEYNVCLFVQEEENLCSKTMCRKISVGTTGVYEIEQFKPLNLYPNPSSNGSIISIEGFDLNDIGVSAEIRITDTNGRLIQMSKETLTATQRVNIDKCKGVYFIRIQTDDTIYIAMGIRQ